VREGGEGGGEEETLRVGGVRRACGGGLGGPLGEWGGDMEKGRAAGEEVEMKGGGGEGG